MLLRTNPRIGINSSTLYCYFTIVLLFVFLGSGCSDPSSSSTATAEKSTEGGSGSGERKGGRPMGTGSLSAKVPPLIRRETAEKKAEVNISSWEDILATVKASGKPTVLDVWSLSCEPCMTEFHGLVKLHKMYGDWLNCVSVNVDFDGRRTRPPENYLGEATNFLDLHAAEFANYISSTPSDEVFSALGIVSIPAVLIFDAEGNEVARFVDEGETRGFTYDKNIMPFVRDSLPVPDTGKEELPSDTSLTEESAADEAAEEPAGNNELEDDGAKEGPESNG